MPGNGISIMYYIVPYLSRDIFRIFRGMGKGGTEVFSGRPRLSIVPVREGGA
jgi:hypothetical protein